MKRHLQTYLSAVIVVSLLLVVIGCSQRQPPAGEIKSVSESTSESESVAESVAEPTGETPEVVPDSAPPPNIEITIELAQEILERQVVTMQQGLYAPGGMGEFYQAHPDFLNDQSYRLKISTGNEVEDGGEHARLLLPKGVFPANDLINRERLALFAENYGNKIPDSIVILSSGDPISLWITVFTYSGGDSYTVQSCYPKKDELEWSPAYTVNQLTETDREWILLNEPMQKIRFPKYGYEPIPLGAVIGVYTQAEVLEHVEQLRRTEYPQTDSVLAVEPQTVNGVPCYVFALQSSGEYAGDSLAVAKTLSRYYEIEQVNGQWVLQARPKAPDMPYAQRMSTDLSGISTQWGAEYRNDSLGIAIQFPESWAYNYTPILSEQPVTADEIGIRIDFCYKNDPQASMACVIAMSEQAWQENQGEIAKNGGPGWGAMAGKNSSFVFAGDWSHAPQYDNSPNQKPCDELSLAGRSAMTEQITIYEPTT